MLLLLGIQHIDPDSTSCRTANTLSRAMSKPRNFTSWSAGNWSTHLRLANSLMDRIAELGVSINPASRYPRYARILQSLSSGDVPSNPSREEVSLAHQAIRELTQLEHIVDAVGQLEESRAWLGRLEVAVNGPALVENESQDTGARDAQFELLTAALFSRACRIELAEPDVVVRFGDHEFGLASKRISSARKVQRRIRDAIDQLRRADLEGLPCLDLSLISHPRDGFLPVDETSQAARWVRAAADALCERCRQYVISLPTSKWAPILGLATYVDVIYRCSRASAFGITSRWSFAFFPGTHEIPRSDLEGIITRLGQDLDGASSSQDRMVRHRERLTRHREGRRRRLPTQRLPSWIKSSRFVRHCRVTLRQRKPWANVLGAIWTRLCRRVRENGTDT